MGDIRCFRVEGHAGYAERGEDIVCAAVSALTIAAVNGLEKYLAKMPLAKAGDGILECTLPALDSEQDRLIARSILGTMLLGLTQIRDNYGTRYISFEQGRWTPC